MKKSKDFVFMLDAGHGGVVDGVYQILKKGSKQYHFKDENLSIYEGEFNRKIVRMIMSKAGHDIKCVDMSKIYGHTEVDFPLNSRVAAINHLTDQYKLRGITPILVSIHGNAGKGTFVEVWTSVGETDSDKYATEFGEAVRAKFPKRKFRADYSDGDLDKESQFYVLRKTKCAAFLTENFFMDTLKDAKYMLSAKGQEEIADYHLDAFKRIISKYREK